MKFFSLKLPKSNKRDVLSRASRDAIIERLNPLLEMMIRFGDKTQVFYGKDNVVLSFDKSQFGGGGGGAGTITEITSTDSSVVITNPTGPIVDLSVAAVTQELTEAVFVSMGYGGNYDYITATIGGVNTQVKLPSLLRFSVGSRSAFGGTITYSGYNATQQSRVASSGGINVTEYITPQYASGDTLYLSKIAGGSVWIDTNNDARQFCGP